MVNLDIYVMENLTVARNQINVEKWKVIVILTVTAWMDSNAEIITVMRILVIGTVLMTVAISQKVSLL